jgi:hypothetical protein
MKGVARIDRVAAVFDIWSDGSLPFAKFKIKVIERGQNDYLGVPNIAIRNPLTGDPEYTSGLGKTIEDALVDTIRFFSREVAQNTGGKELTIADFIWSDFADF